MKISVIMLTYNREKYLEEMIQDIRNQTFQDFEFIIVNNGSIDNSAKIVDKYAEMDKRIKSVHLQKAESIGRGRNIGLEMAQGEFVTFVDDDDRVEKDFLEFLYCLAMENNADISMCGATELMNGQYAPQCMYDEKFILTPQEAVRKLLERKYIRAGMPTKLVKRKLLLDHPFREDVKYEDIHTIYKYFANADKVVIYGIPKYCFIRHGNNNSFFTSDASRITPEQLEEYIEAFSDRTKYIGEKFPDVYDFSKYCEWSYLISMCEKIKRNLLNECSEQLAIMRNTLLLHYEKFYNSKYIEEFEKKWMEMYVNNKIKPSFDENRRVLGEILPLSIPFTVILDVSEACNFQCNYCFRSEKSKKNWGYAVNNELMNWETFEKAVAQISKFGGKIRQLSLSNHGEPLCNRRLPEMVKYIKNRNIADKISIHTNASLLDYEYACELADSNIDRVVVSMQGLSSRKYKEICGVDINFDNLYENLKTLYNRKSNTQIYIKIMETALEEGEENKFYEMFSPIADRVYIEKIVPIWEDVELENVSNNATDASINKYGTEFPKQKCCPLTFHTIVVAPNGDIYPCTQLKWKRPIGNIHQIDLRSCWNGEERRRLLVKQVSLEQETICEKCYILQNSIYDTRDMIDTHRGEILERLKR